MLRGILLGAPLVLSGCLVSPPNESIESPLGTVRADRLDEARIVSAYLSDLRPRVMEYLPDTRYVEDMEVWLQEVPALYRFPATRATGAEGLWAEHHGRILLSRGADDIERTLTHELVHASLGETWHTLPGSLEEGLCDFVSAEICESGAARLRAGRLSSAALACGGLQLELNVVRARDREAAAEGARVPSWTARIVLSGEYRGEDAHLDVFDVQAGLSSSKLAANEKRGFYGLSFLLIDRIAGREGLDSIHTMCLKAEAAGYDAIPTEWLLECAQLSAERGDWRRAAAQAVGEEELLELLRMYPEFVVDVLAGYVEGYIEPGPFRDRYDDLEVTLTVVEGDTALDLSHAAFVRDLVSLRVGDRSRDTAVAAAYSRSNE